MKARLRKIIDYASGGKPIAFAELMGWSTQYLNNLLNTEAGIGLRPVLSVLEKLPEVDARWFLFGTGVMLSDFTRVTREYQRLLLSLEAQADDLSVSDLSRLSSEMALSLARLEGYSHALLEEKSAKKAQE